MEVDLSFKKVDSDESGNPVILVTNNIHGRIIGSVEYHDEAKEFAFELLEKEDRMTSNGMLAISEYLSYINEHKVKSDELNSSLEELDRHLDSVLERLNALLEDELS